MNGITSLAVRAALVFSPAAAVETALLLASEDACARLGALTGGPGSDFASVLTDVAVLAALAAWSWLILSGIATVVAAVKAEATGLCAAMARIMPAAARQLLLWLLGLGVVTVSAGVVSAEPSSGPSPVTVEGLSADPHAPDARALRGLPLPDRPRGDVRRAPDQRPERTAVVVRPGDTLWGIVARFLGATASTAQIATAWPDWYAANRPAIGADPDLIFPDTTLRPPATLPPDERSMP